MSKKKNRLGNSEDIVSGIADRLNNEAKKKKDKDKKEHTEDEKEKAPSNNSENKESEEKNKSDNKKDESNSKNKNNKSRDVWGDEQEPYRSSFIIKPDMEDDFDSCKKIFRKQFRMTLSKQNAIELGWLLLKNLDDKYFEEVKATSSPEDDLINELKKVIDEYF